MVLNNKLLNTQLSNFVTNLQNCYFLDTSNEIRTTNRDLGIIKRYVIPNNNNSGTLPLSYT